MKLYKTLTNNEIIQKTFSINRFRDNNIESIKEFILDKSIVLEILFLLNKDKIGTKSRLIQLKDISKKVRQITEINKIEADEYSKMLIYFMEYCNFILEDQSKKSNFLVEDTGRRIIKEYSKVRSKVITKDFQNFGKVIRLKTPSLMNKLIHCFLFGRYITFGRNRVSTIYKTLDILSLPYFNQSLTENTTCSKFLSNTKLAELPTPNMKTWGELIRKYNHTYSNRKHKWEERARERMYMCIYFGWGTKKVINGRDSFILTRKGKEILIKYNKVRELISETMNLSEEKFIPTLFKSRSNKRKLDELRNKHSFEKMLNNLKMSKIVRRTALKNQPFINSMLTELDKKIIMGLIYFRVTNPYHSTRVHQDFHAKPFVTLLRTLKVLGPCSVNNLSTIILQFKDFKNTKYLNELLNRIKEDHTLFDKLIELNKFALSRRWNNKKRTITTIQGSLDKYIIDFALDLNLIDIERGNCKISKLGIEVLEAEEKEIVKINKINRYEFKIKIINILKIEKIEIIDIPKKLTYSLLIKHKMSNLMFNKFNDNIYDAVNFIFPGKFNQWEFEGFNWNLDNAKAATRWLIKDKLNYTDSDIKNKVSIKTFYDAGLFNMLKNFFAGYISVAIMHSFPEKKFKGSDFRYPRIYLKLGLVFQKILKEIYLSQGLTEGKDFLYDKNYKDCRHERKCRPDFQFKDNKHFTDRWVDAKFSNFTVFSSDTLRYKDECENLEIVYLRGEKDFEFELEGISMKSVHSYLPYLKKKNRMDLVRALELVNKEIVPPAYKPTKYDRKMIEAEIESISKGKR
jgi:hypothetical protein